MSLEQIRIALSVASQMDSRELRTLHLAQARALHDRQRDELRQIETLLVAQERELARTARDVTQLPLPERGG